MFQRLKAWLKKTHTRELGCIIIAVPLAVTALGFFMATRLLSEPLLTVAIHLVTLFEIFAFGGFGAFTILRKELYQGPPWMRPMRGRVAIIYGVIIIAASAYMCWFVLTNLVREIVRLGAVFEFMG